MNDPSVAKDLPRGRTMSRKGDGLTSKRPKRTSSLLACFSGARAYTIREQERSNLLMRMQGKSDDSHRRCFTLPPILPSDADNDRDLLNLEPLSPSLTSIRNPSMATVDDVNTPSNRRSLWRPAIWKISRRVRTQSEVNQSFLRAARSGNIGKIAEYLNTNVDLNVVNPVSYACVKCFSCLCATILID